MSRRWKIGIYAAVAALLAAALLTAEIVVLSPQVKVVPSPEQLPGDDYRIHFVKSSDRPHDTRSAPKFMSVSSDGTAPQVSNPESPDVYRRQASATGVESMMGYHGDFLSPDGKKRIILRTPIPVIGPTELLIEENGRMEPMMWGDFYELEWFPDSRRIAIAELHFDEGNLGILDVSRKTYAPLAKGYGLGSIVIMKTSGQ